MNIELVVFNNDFKPLADGKYLIRTEEFVNSDMKMVRYKEARIKKYQDENKNDLYTIDLNYKTITHISKEPLS